MTKQEKIQEAYGDNWELVKDYIDKNGWVESGYFDINTKLIRVVDNFQGEKETKYDLRNSNYVVWRPKSLQGIENNNGWIKIESEEQIKEFQNEFCWVVMNNGEMDKGYIHSSNYNFLLKSATHYQPIQKPQPPIY